MIPTPALPVAFWMSNPAPILVFAGSTAAGVHPLQAWDGQLPATEGMICGVGEAPTAIVAHRGWLWVTSWGEHRIERYRLSEIEQNGKWTLQAERQIVVQGVADFRPTGMAIAPDGSLYFGDWVSRSYPVHGRGRIWRLEIPEDEHTEPLPSTEFVPLRDRVVSREGQGGLDAMRRDTFFVNWNELSASDRLGLLQVARDEEWLSSELLATSREGCG